MIVYVVVACTTVGVPDIAPFDVENDNPEESAGEILKDVALFVQLLTVKGVITFPFTNLLFVNKYTQSGLASLKVVTALEVTLNGLVKCPHEHTVCNANAYVVDGDNPYTAQDDVMKLFMLEHCRYCTSGT